MAGPNSFDAVYGDWKPPSSAEWQEDSKHWRGVVLGGRFRHWCLDWDALPTDETCVEFTCCNCFPETEEITRLKNLLREKRREMEQDAQ